MPGLVRLFRLLLRILAHPGKPPLGWAKTASLVFLSTIVLIVVLIVLGVVAHDAPSRYFKEGRPGTIANVVALLVAGCTAMLIWRDLPRSGLARFWLLTGIGFILLGLDDGFEGHEKLDVAINTRLGIDPEHPAADPLDDLIVALYSVVAWLVAWPQRLRLLRVRWLTVCVAVATVLFAVMVGLDLSGSNRTLEESSKLLSGVLLALGVAAARMTYAERAELARIAGRSPTMREGAARMQARRLLEAGNAARRAQPPDRCTRQALSESGGQPHLR
jgi:hypothetical protein